LNRDQFIKLVFKIASEKKNRKQTLIISAQWPKLSARLGPAALLPARLAARSDGHPGTRRQPGPGLGKERPAWARSRPVGRYPFLAVHLDRMAIRLSRWTKTGGRLLPRNPSFISIIPFLLSRVDASTGRRLSRRRAARSVHRYKAGDPGASLSCLYLFFASSPLLLSQRRTEASTGRWPPMEAEENGRRRRKPTRRRAPSPAARRRCSGVHGRGPIFSTRRLG